MAFNITSNVLTMLNTMANMKTARTAEEKRKEETESFKKYKEENPRTGAKNYSEAMAEQTAANTKALVGMGKAGVEQRNFMMDLVSPITEKTLDENRESAEQDMFDAADRAAQAHYEAYQAKVADSSRLPADNPEAYEIAGDPNLDLIAQNMAEDSEAAQESFEIADQQLYNYVKNKEERLRKQQEWKEMLFGGKK